MSDLKVIILEINKFTSITEESLKACMPGVPYKIVKPSKNGFISTALAHSEGHLCLVVTSGIALFLKEGDLPSIETLRKYHLCASRGQVYSDNKKYVRFYKYLDKDPNPKGLDLSIFIINPAMWPETPQSDKGILQDKKLLAMPRYMNHRVDDLVKKCLSPYAALKYGMLGEQAAVLNYRECLESGSASTIERYAYCFDKLEPFCLSLPEKEKSICLNLISKSTMAKTRSKLAKALGYRR